MSRSKNRKIADLISGTTFDDGVVAASEVTGLATVATSGSFNDLSNQPTPFDPSTLGTASTQATGAFATAAQGTTANAALPKAGGAVTGNVTFGDSNKIVMGAGSDLSIYHDGSASRIHDNGTGNLILSATDFQMNNGANNETMFTAVSGGAVTLKHSGNSKLATFSGGVSVTGSVNADGLSLGDGDIANFGNSNDLQISHDGSNSWIKDTGYGNLKISAGNFEVVGAADTNKAFLYGIENGSLYLYNNGTQKLEITGSGIDVTGTVNADALTGIGSIDATTATAIGAAGVGGAVTFISKTNITSTAAFIQVPLASGYKGHIVIFNDIRNTDTSYGTEGRMTLTNSGSTEITTNGYYSARRQDGDSYNVDSWRTEVGLPPAGAETGQTVVTLWNARDSNARTHGFCSYSHVYQHPLFGQTSSVNMVSMGVNNAEDNANLRLKPAANSLSGNSDSYSIWGIS